MNGKGWKSSPAKSPANARLCFALPFRAIGSFANGIEKVRGSTPLISTTEKAA
ncbi:MAG: hypothetical protein II840_10950 [Kiritimatiellae bacterium]|nr:hypothetical protein [Kiritimatiellia bacterium]